MKEKFRKIRRTIKEQLKNRKFVRLFLSLALIILLPLFVVIVNKSQDIRQHASAAQPITFVDNANNPITQTTSPMVHVALTSPWGIQSGITMDTTHHAVLDLQTAVFQGTTSYDDVNEVNGTLDPAYGPTYKTVWLGTGSANSVSYTGFRFTNVSVPKGAKIVSANVQVYSVQNQWISMRFEFAGDDVGNSAPFSATSIPSHRTLTVARVQHSSNTNWKSGVWYTMNNVAPIVQEVVNGNTWQSGNNLSLILKGKGYGFGRKFVASIDNGLTTAPKLVITYEPSTSVVTPTPTSTQTVTTIPTSTVAPTATPTVMPTASPTPVIYTKDILLAEDSGFTKNVITISSLTSNPVYATYTFSDTTPGVKTLYAKFRASDGSEQVYSNTISLVSSLTPTPVSQNGENSYAMGLWTPNIKYDTCPSYPTSADTNGNGVIEDSEKIAYIKAIHDSYKVKGPDGKWYPTWHPPVDPTTGCKFGHEHGRDPRGSELWKTKQIQNFFFYDANKNLIMDPSEEEVTGIPFGYVNEQMDTYYAFLGKTIMRHEDHMGHKVEYANGEGDIRTDQNGDTSLTGGVRVQRNNPFTDTGVRCYYLAKPHQGVSSPDAFTNNIHEVFYFADCRYANNPALNEKISIAEMEAFGKPGGFTSFMPMCGIERRDDPQDFINLGTDSMNSQYPTGDGDREIITRDCIEKGFLVPQGQFSGNMYEAWPASLSVKDPTGKSLVSGINLLFDVEDANRYFYPDAEKALRGYNNPDAKPNLGYTMDLCYDTSLQSEGRIARGGACDYATNYGQIKDIKWNDPRSAFRGLHRGMYFQAGIIDNAGGPEYWYTDPYGENASKTPFPGSIRQQITPASINYGEIFGIPLDPRVNDREHDDGNGTVHAPN